MLSNFSRWQSCLKIHDSPCDFCMASFRTTISIHKAFLLKRSQDSVAGEMASSVNTVLARVRIWVRIPVTLIKLDTVIETCNLIALKVRWEEGQGHLQKLSMQLAWCLVILMASGWVKEVELFSRWLYVLTRVNIWTTVSFTRGDFCVYHNMCWWCILLR